MDRSTKKKDHEPSSNKHQSVYKKYVTSSSGNKTYNVYYAIFKSSLHEHRDCDSNLKVSRQ